MFTQPWAVSWRKALVSVPRLVPDLALRFTSPEGPHPIVLNIPSRGSHLIPLYIFIPPDSVLAQHEKGELALRVPVLLDFHGGGFVLGSCQEQAPFCAQFARELGCISISVDYRLGPYNTFPAAHEDGEDVLNAILKPGSPGYSQLREGIKFHMDEHYMKKTELDCNRVAVSGFSAGGNIALNLVMNMGPPQLDKPWPCPFPHDYPSPIPALLYYAVVDSRKRPSERARVAVQDKAPRSVVGALNIEGKLMNTYMTPEQAASMRGSPGIAPIEDGGLHDKARPLLILAEKDGLTPQNEEWFEKVVAAGRGKDIRLEKYLGVSHGWTQFPDAWIDQHARDTKKEAHGKAVEFVREMWYKPT